VDPFRLLQWRGREGLRGANVIFPERLRRRELFLLTCELWEGIREADGFPPAPCSLSSRSRLILDMSFAFAGSKIPELTFALRRFLHAEQERWIWKSRAYSAVVFGGRLAYMSRGSGGHHGIAHI